MFDYRIVSSFGTELDGGREQLRGKQRVPTLVYVATALSEPGPPYYRGFTVTDTPHSVELLWTGDQPDAGNYT